MEFPPDRKPSRHWIVQQKFSKEPPGWFTVDLDQPIDNGLRLDTLFVLTCDPERLEKMLDLNSSSVFKLIPSPGKRGDIPCDSIFDNYMEILSRVFSDESLDFVGIIEDDVVLLEGAYGALQKSLSELPEDWDTLSGNLSMYTKATQKSESTILIDGHASSLNLTIFSRKSFLKILENLDLRKRYPHLDRFIFSPECQMNSYCCWPMICRENPGYSINQGSLTDSFGHLIQNEPYKYWFMDFPKWRVF